MNVERRLVELAGPVGGKLHTGRSRNDQIALDERLYLRDILDHVDAGLREVEGALVAQAEKHRDAPMPGYTHLQRAQPVLLAHHLLAYVFMLERDRQRFREGRARVNVMPLGSGALAGAAFAIDRETDRIYLRALRSLDLLDFEGFCELLEVVARVADDLQGKLRAQFGVSS